MNTVTLRSRRWAALAALPIALGALTACGHHETPRPAPAPAPVPAPVHNGGYVPDQGDHPWVDPTQDPLADPSDPCAGLTDPQDIASCLVDQLLPSQDDPAPAPQDDPTSPPQAYAPDDDPNNPQYWNDVCGGGACDPGGLGMPDFTPGGGLSFGSP